jgi:hypothetical protein
MTSPGGESTHSAGSPGGGTRRLSGAVAALLGWAGVGLVNAVGLFGVPLRRGGAGERALHHVYDFGHALALGLLAFGTVLLVARFGPKRPLLRVLLLAPGSVATAVWLLAEDLGGTAERVAGTDTGWPLRLLCAVAGLSVPLAFLASLLPARLAARLPSLLLGAVLVGGNERVLVNGYPGVHRWVALTGATLLAASAAGLPLRGPLFAVAERLTPVRARVALGVLTALSLVTLAVPPPSDVELAMLERDTALLAAPLTELHAPKPAIASFESIDARLRNHQAPEEVWEEYLPLMQAQIPIIAGLINIDALIGEPKVLFLALPLPLSDATGSPVRAMALLY